MRNAGRDRSPGPGSGALGCWHSKQISWWGRCEFLNLGSLMGFSRFYTVVQCRVLQFWGYVMVWPSLLDPCDAILMGNVRFQSGFVSGGEGLSFVRKGLQQINGSMSVPNLKGFLELSLNCWTLKISLSSDLVYQDLAERALRKRRKRGGNGKRRSYNRWGQRPSGSISAGCQCRGGQRNYSLLACRILQDPRFLEDIGDLGSWFQINHLRHRHDDSPILQPFQSEGVSLFVSNNDRRNHDSSKICTKIITDHLWSIPPNIKHRQETMVCFVAAVHIFRTMDGGVHYEWGMGLMFPFAKKVALMLCPSMSQYSLSKFTTHLEGDPLKVMGVLYSHSLVFGENHPSAFRRSPCLWASKRRGCGNWHKRSRGVFLWGKMTWFSPAKQWKKLGLKSIKSLN